MRTFAALTVTGVAGILLFKLLAALIFPLFGVFLGILAMTVKLALIAAVVFFFYSMLKKKREAEVS
ncbi:MAG TPA: hypothetical protein VK849_09310 [Longimicrobiales bacterium]|nr:hypothetical protein [Longimicrobiales bacterium]